MEQSKQQAECDDKINKNKRENDDELDITSENFNPLKALYSEQLKLPVKNVKRLDNLAVFLARLKNAGDKVDSEVRSYWALLMPIINDFV